MEIKEMQQNCASIVTKIDKKLNVAHDDYLSIIHLIEELGEISRELLNQKLKRGNKNIENLSEELADVIFFISKIADNNKINLENSILNKIEKLKLRHNLK